MTQTDWLTLERFDCAPLAGRWGVVRMMAALSEQPQIPATPRLVVTRPEVVTAHGAFVNATDRRGSQLLWLASFAVPLEVAEHPQALFELVAPGLPAIALPAPGTLILPLSARAELRLARRLPQLRLGRRATAMATALALSATSLPVTGLAAAKATPPLHVAHGDPAAGAAPEVSPAAQAHPVVVAHVALPDKRVVKLATTPPDAHPDPSAPKTGHATPKTKLPRPVTAKLTPTANGPGAKHHPGSKHPSKAKHPTSAKKTSPAASQPRSGSWKPSPPTTSSPSPLPGGTTSPSTPKSKPDAAHHPAHAKSKHRPRSAGPRVILPTGGAPIAPLSSTPPNIRAHAHPSAAVSAVTAVPSVTSGGTPGPGTAPSTSISTMPPPALLARIYGDLQGPPPFLVEMYKQAQARYGVPWQVLAAINSVETNYGRDLSVSSAGAEGWMQFMPETWSQWGVDANGDGKKNPYDPRDAIFAAARYLRASGAPRDMRRAVFAYNHANWYVEDVMRRAQWIADTAGVPVRGKAGHQIKAMKAKADELMGLPYVWGGGHGGWQLVGGYDCSGFVSAVLHAGGYLGSPQTTDTLPGQTGIASGPGRYVTIFDRTGNGGHVIIDLGGTFYESGGSTLGGGGAGVKKITPPLDYLVTFNTILHPRGL